MACFHPLFGFQKPGGGRLTFKDPNPGDLGLAVPCGRCVGCREDRSKAWAVRIVHEQQLHADSCFITLTYDDEHLPYGGTLHYPHFQRFMKRMRERLSVPIRFFMCGEYGEKLSRPHYHACVFGYGFRSDRKPFKNSSDGQVLYTSDLLSEIWTDGFASVGELSFESAAYVARYCMKKMTGAKAELHYEKLVLDTGEILSIVPEFARMSLKPGIASEWYDKYASDVYPRDFVPVAGRKYRPPRFYDKKLEVSDPIVYDELKAKRLATAMACVDDCTPDRLRVREVVKMAGMTNTRKI